MDVLAVSSGRLVLHGWLFQPGRTFDAVTAHLDGARVGPVRIVDRQDVVESFAWADDARPSSFALEIDLTGPSPARVDVLGCVGGAPVARLSCFMSLPDDAGAADPPDYLQERVSALHGPAFRAQGLRMFTDLVDQMARFGIPTAGRILDWGCGCGRVTRHFLARVPAATILGCDIDAESMAWCARHFGGRFVQVDLMPPLPFGEATFDVAIGCSVLTHLSAAVQEAWLEEMRRVLVPGGHLLVSTQGEYAFELAHPGPTPRPSRSLVQRLVGARGGGPRLEGIDDATADPALDGIAPPGYYRGVFQSRAHTLAVCERHFYVVDYVERGLNGHQDLVILRRPA
jgi:SAM-dependent methyltransferase